MTAPSAGPAHAAAAAHGEPDDLREVSVGQLLSDVSRDLSTLMRQEVELAKVEIKTEASKAAKGAGMLGAWTPPAGLGPLPPELADRAAAVAGVQRGALARLDAARKAVLAHLGVVRSVESSHEPERPVYLDATG